MHGVIGNQLPIGHSSYFTKLQICNFQRHQQIWVSVSAVALLDYRTDSVSTNVYSAAAARVNRQVPSAPFSRDGVENFLQGGTCAWRTAQNPWQISVRTDTSVGSGLEKKMTCLGPSSSNTVKLNTSCLNRLRTSGHAAPGPQFCRPGIGAIKPVARVSNSLHADFSRAALYNCRSPKLVSYRRSYHWTIWKVLSPTVGHRSFTSLAPLVRFSLIVCSVLRQHAHMCALQSCHKVA